MRQWLRVEIGEWEFVEVTLPRTVSGPRPVVWRWPVRFICIDDSRTRNPIASVLCEIGPFLQQRENENTGEGVLVSVRKTGFDSDDQIIKNHGFYCLTAAQAFRKHRWFGESNCRICGEARDLRIEASQTETETK